MKRIIGWTLAGAMVLGGSALAGDDTKYKDPSQQQQSSSQQDPGALRVGEAEALDKDSSGSATAEQSQGTGGSGSPEAQRQQEHTGGKQTSGDSKESQGTGGSTGSAAAATSASAGGGMDSGGIKTGAAQDPAQLMKQGLLPVPSDEQAFLERLHHSNLKEVELGKLAQQKASSPEVKKFGEMMERDHTQGAQKVKDYAQKKGLTLNEGEPQPANDFEQKMVAAHKAQTEKLQVLEGKVFDQAYLTAMVGAHDSTLAKLNGGVKQFGKGELATLLTQMTTKVKQHREHAYRLLGKEAKAAPGVGGSGKQSEKSEKSDPKNM